MIIRRAFYREAGLMSLGAATVMLVLFVFLGLTQLLGQAAAGKHASEIVFLLLGLEIFRKLELLVPLAVYVGILLTLARWYRDSEMMVLAASGVGLWAVLRPVMQLAFVSALLIAAFSLYLSPWASALGQRAKAESKSRAEISLVSPGVFTELRAPHRILYVEKVVAGAKLERIFVNDRGTEKQNVLVAATGEQYTDAETGEKFLLLKKGSVYEGLPGERDYRIVNFEQYGLRIEAPAAAIESLEVAALPTARLLRSDIPRHSAELHERLARPVTVLVLAAFALVLAHTDARRGRIINLMAAILVYFIYNNLLVTGQVLLKAGRVPPALGLWWVHAFMAAAAVYLLARRARNKPLLPLPAIRIPWHS